MISIATFDIETTNLNADFGVVLCSVVKPSDGKAVVIRGDKLNPKWATRRSNDKATVERTIEELRKYDILIAHNGLRFDIPYLNTRAAMWGIPPLTQKKVFDPVLIARQHMRMSWNSLDKLAGYLGVNSKTVVDGKQWTAAALDGSRAAMNYIVEHCIEDVKTLEKIVDAVKPYSTAFNSWGSAR